MAKAGPGKVAVAKETVAKIWFTFNRYQTVLKEMHLTKCVFLDLTLRYVVLFELENTFLS